MQSAVAPALDILETSYDPVESISLFKRSKPIIGVVGGIGSGKSMVASLFAELGAKIVHADDLVHQAYRDPQLQNILRNWWGDIAIQPDGSVNRKLIADKVFSDPIQLKKLEELVHPIVHQEREKLTGEYLANPNCTAVVWDIPLLVETELHTLCDAVVYVDVSQKTRLERIKGRGWTENELLRRENLQFGLDKKKELANYYVSNEADIGSARIQVRQVFSRILANDHHTGLS